MICLTCLVDHTHYTGLLLRIITLNMLDIILLFLSYILHQLYAHLQNK